MNKTDDLMLPEPEFRLKWKDGAYYVSKPSIGDTDVFTADQMREYAELVRADEREAMVAEAAKKGWAMRGEDPFEDCVREIADIRARGNT